ncbi:1-propanol dehydrogenase PduQ [uncultured Veillonella sp.]|uniref:1-propanol dehydrogenase PduQ n=1 Tax=uncultured Veillonella sp. TaxID=159268 RepID=UPI0026193E9F|nr:1-propanol dehydrogenase PduQ [uncultured Veillonella sp.]
MEQFKFTGQVFSGDDSLSVLSQINCHSALLVTDKFMVEFGYLKEVEALLANKGITVSCFDGVLPDPSTAVIAEGVKVYAAAKPDLVIAVGGGSVIDAAKGIMYFNRQVESSSQWQKPTFVAIPTTSGTGSECTSFAVITSEKGKICIIEDWLVPDIAILDANYTMGVPEKITYDTGMDVLTHALEAYVSTNATSFTDGLAEKATRMVLENLPKLKLNLKDKAARHEMHKASCIAGIAFSQASLGLNHSLAHALGGRFHVPHGRANTVLIETIMDYNVGEGHLEGNAVAKKYAELAKAVGLSARTVREGYMNLRAAIVSLKQNLGVPKNIQALGIEEGEFNSAISDMAKNAMEDRCTPTAPRQPKVEDIECLYKKAYTQRF